MSKMHFLPKPIRPLADERIVIPIPGLIGNSNLEEKPKVRRECCGGERNENCIVKDWRVLMRMLRVIGSCPCIERLKSGKSKLRFIFCSWITIYSLALCVGRILLLSFYFFSDHYGNENVAVKGLIPRWVLRSIYLIFPIQFIWNVLCIWLSLGKYIKLFNRWQEFSQEFATKFPGFHYRCELLKWRRLMIVLTAVPSLTISIMSLCYFSTFNWYLTNRVLTKAYLIYSIALEEAQILVAFRTNTEAFRNVRWAIKQSTALKSSAGRIPNQAPTSVTMESVNEWRQILNFIRRQVKLTGETHAPHEIMTLAMTVIYYTQSLFITLIGFFQPDYRETLAWAWGLVSGGHVLRLVLKVIFADQISGEEEKIANVIGSLSALDLELPTQFELKKLIDELIQKPSKISLAGFVCMERRLIPKITSYILAYLVVLIQFHMTSWHAPGSTLMDVRTSEIVTSTDATESA